MANVEHHNLIALGFERLILGFGKNRTSLRLRKNDNIMANNVHAAASQPHIVALSPERLTPGLVTYSKNTTHH